MPQPPRRPTSRSFSGPPGKAGSSRPLDRAADKPPSAFARFQKKVRVPQPPKHDLEDARTQPRPSVLRVRSTADDRSERSGDRRPSSRQHPSGRDAGRTPGSFTRHQSAHPSLDFEQDLDDIAPRAKPAGFRDRPAALRSPRSRPGMAAGRPLPDRWPRAHGFRPGSGFDDPVLVCASKVIAQADDHGKPADRALREVLRGERDLSPVDTRQVVRAVFAYYRWHAWLNPEEPRRRKLRSALDLADRFARAPEAFSDRDLMRAVPAWVHEQMEVVPAWLRALQVEPVLWLRAKPGTGAALTASLGDCRPAGRGQLADALCYVGDTDLFRAPQFHAGDFEVQDLHSQAVAWLCDPEPGQMWWDACAGEGGKLLHLSALMENRGLIWASDRADWRLRQLKRRAGRAGVFNYRAVAWDGGRRLPTRTQFDGVLVDAPCTNLGTWGRNPHARWTTTPDDVRELAAMQLSLLSHAAQAVKPGGKLLFAVCTLTRAETTGLADAFEAAHPGWMPIELSCPFESNQPAAGRLWLLPQDRAANGMFIAAWRRSTQQAVAGPV